MPTTSYGSELAPGDHTDIDDAPVCCGNDMTGKTTPDGGRDYTCGICRTVVAIAVNGLVTSIADWPPAPRGPAFEPTRRPDPTPSGLARGRIRRPLPPTDAAPSKTSTHRPAQPSGRSPP
jgi:hypothetical protein